MKHAVAIINVSNIISIVPHSFHKKITREEMLMSLLGNVNFVLETICSRVGKQEN